MSLLAFFISSPSFLYACLLRHQPDHCRYFSRLFALEGDNISLPNDVE